MSHLKTLLKAKQHSARLQHAHARYSASGQLSCSLCSVKLKSDALWGSHVVSKQHRANAKAHAPDPAPDADDDSRKRARHDGGEGEGAEPDSKRARDSALPDDFFADPSQAPPLPEHPAQADSAPSDSPSGDDDPEMAAFLAGLDGLDDGPVPGPSTATATFSAAPVEYEFGAPRVAEEGEQEDVQDQAEEEEEEQETEEDRIARERREEAEEIIQRMEEEEREQKEADDKVTVSKFLLWSSRACPSAVEWTTAA